MARRAATLSSPDVGSLLGLRWCPEQSQGLTVAFNLLVPAQITCVPRNPFLPISCLHAPTVHCLQQGRGTPSPWQQQYCEGEAAELS